MIVKKYLVIILVFLIGWTLWAEQIIDTGVFIHDKTVNNAFIGQYTLGDDPDIFNNFFAIDTASYQQGGFVYGIGVDKYKNLFYYFDFNKKSEYFGVDLDTGERALKLVDKVATTKSGKFYAIDCITEEIYYWDIKGSTFLPEGKIDKVFKNLEDIYCDNDVLFILDNKSREVFKYSVADNKFLQFDYQNKQSFQYHTVITSSWGNARGLIAADNFIYIVFERGKLLKLSKDGRLIGMFSVDRDNINLISRREKYNSELWWESIAIGPYGNIYILDTRDKKIHILNENLEYISSWKDSSHVLEDKATDICFIKGTNYLSTSHSWGFYTHQLSPKLAGISCEDKFIYPEYINEEYKGLEIDLSVIGSGFLDIAIENDGEEIVLLDNHYLDHNERFKFVWDGKDKLGNTLAYGSYKVSFYLNDHADTELPIEIRKGPEIVLFNSTNKVIDSENSTATFNYSVSDNGIIRISLWDDEEIKSYIDEVHVSEGSYSFLINEYIIGEQLEDGYYQVKLEIVPVELQYYSSIGDLRTSTFLVNREELTLGQIENQSTGFNPTNPDLSEMNASFFISEGAFISAEILDDNLNVVLALFSDIYYGAGDNALVWNGKDNDKYPINDGLYKFRFTAEQPEINVSLYETGELFELDTTAPFLDCNISQIDKDGQSVIYPGTYNSIYISNDEASSIGIKDNLTATVSYNETVTFTSDIYSGSDSIRTLLDETLLAENESVDFFWDGIDNLGFGVEDGLYLMKLQAEDEYGNVLLKNVRVLVDNNRINEDDQDGIIVPYGPEFQVNTYTLSDQSNSAVAATEDGFVITWDSYNQDESSAGIYAQMFDVGGSPVGVEFQVNTYTENNQNNSAVIAIEGGFVITWDSYIQDGSKNGIYAQILDESGNSVGGEFQVNTYTLSDQSNSAVAATEDGFIITWSSYQNGSGGIYAQRFDNSGNSLGLEFQVNTYTDNFQIYPAVAATEDGFIIVWTSFMQDGSSFGVYAQKFDAGGAPIGGEFRVNTYTENAQIYPAVAVTEGCFIITWNSYQNGRDSGIYAQRFDISGNSLGSEFQVNTSTDNYQNSPDVAATEDGFIIVWASDDHDGSSSGVYAQKFDTGGTPIGGEFQVINYTENTQYYPAVTAIDEGYVISWTSNGQDGSGNEIYGQLYQSIPISSNLTTLITNPTLSQFLVKDNFPIEGIVRDRHLESYKLSLHTENEETILESAFGTNIAGKIHNFYILDIPQGSTVPVILEAWDKAGNYRSDSFELTRDYSDGVITNYRLENIYCSALQPLSIDYSLTESASAVLTIKDGTSIIRQFNQPIGLKINDLILDTTGLGDGNYTLELSTEVLGSSYSMDLDFTLDNTEPIVTFGDFYPYFSTQENQPIPTQIEEINLASFSLTLFDNMGTLVKLLGAGNNISDLESVMFNPINFVEENYSLVLLAHDLSGNSSNTNVDIIVDRTAPVVSFSSPDFSFVQQGDINIEGTVSDIGGFSDYIINFKREAELPVEIMTGNTELISFTWINSGFLNPVLNGDLSCTLTDLAGNSSVTNFPLIIDNNPPSVELKLVEQPFLIEDDQFISGTNLLYFTAQSNDSFSTVEEINYRINEEAWTIYTGGFSLESEGTYGIEYFAVDSLGNRSEILNTTFLVDASAPLCELSIDMPKYLDNGITYIPLENRINLVFTDGASGLSSGVSRTEYRINEGSWQVYEGRIIIYQEGPVAIRTKVSDNVGNSREEDAVEVIVDLAPPSTQYEIDNEYYQSFQRNIIALALESSITLSAEDLGYEKYTSGVNSTFIVQDGVEIEYSEPVLLSSTIPSEYSFYSIDNVGNMENMDPVLIAIDDVAPEVRCIIPDGAYVEDDHVFVHGGSPFILTAEDNFAGVRDIMFGFDGIEYSQYSDFLVWEDEEGIDLYYYAEDNIGLSSDIKNMSILIDNTAPVTMILKDLALIEIDGVLYADDSYEFSWSAVDTGSGVYETFVFFDGARITNSPFVFTDEGEHYIVYYSIDNLGNSEIENELTIVTPIPDITPPVSALSQSYPPWTGGSMDYYKSTVEFTLSAEDISGQYNSFSTGIDKVFYRTDSDTYRCYIDGSKIAFTPEGLHSIYYYAVDLSGNIEQVNNYYLTIDDSAPVTDLAFDSDKYLEIENVLFIPESEKINLIAQDAYAGVKETYYRLESDSAWRIFGGAFLLMNGTYELSWYSIDNLGNTENVKTQLLNITNNYNVSSYSTSVITGLSDHIVDYDISGDRMVYIKGSGKSHIYLKELDGQNHVIFSHSTRLSAWRQERTDIVLGDEWIAAVEESSSGQHIILYNLEDQYQHGIPVSGYGINRDPFFIGNNLYWIQDDGVNQSICKYDPDSETVDVLFETLDTIWGFQRNNGQISFIVESEKNQKVYTHSGDLITKVLTRKITEGIIYGHSLYSGILAIETEGSVISVYHQFADGPILLFQINGT